MKKTILLVLVLLIIPIAIAVDECKSAMNPSELPCQVFLPVNVSLRACDTINLTIFRNSTFIISDFMLELNSFTCSGNFTQTSLGSYTFSYSTGDSGSITIEEDTDTRYHLYIIAILILFILIGLGYYIEDETFLILGGMLSIVIAVNLFVNGFPLLLNEFLQNGIIVVFAGIGFYYVLVPSVKVIQEYNPRGDQLE